MEEINVVLIGDSGVGKTCIANRFVNDLFDDCKNTINIDNFKKEYNCNDQLFLIKIWDTAGQEKYRSLVPLSYRGANVIIMVFACDDDRTLEGLDNWESNLKESIDTSSVSIFIVGSKSDLVDQINQQKIINRAKNKFPDINENKFFIISSKNGDNVNDLFERLVNCYIEEKSTKHINGVMINDPNPEKSCC